MKIVAVVMNNCVNDARVLNEAIALRDFGHNVHILGYSEEASIPDRDRFQVEISHVYSVLPKKQRLRILTWARTVLEFLHFWYKAGIFILKFKPDIVHLHDIHTLPIGWISLKLLRIPFVYDYHELWIDQNPSKKPGPMKKWMIATFERFFAREATRLITVNQSLAAYVSESYKVPMPLVLRNCKLSPIFPVMPLKQQLGLSPDHFLILYTGLVTPGRGIQTLLPVLKVFPNVHFCCMGPVHGEYSETLKAIATQSGVNDRLHLIPAVSPDVVTSVVATADLSFVSVQNSCLSYYLSLPNKFFEAISGGTPVLSIDFPEYKSLVDQYQVGQTYSPNVPGSLENALKMALDPELRKKWKAGVLKAQTELNWNVEKQKLLEVYPSPL